MNYYIAAAFFLSLITALISSWNAYHNLKISNIVLELQLNMRREFNGRYVSIERFTDFQEAMREQLDLKTALRPGHGQ